MKELDADKFASYYYEKIAPLIAPFETKRKWTLFWVVLLWAVAGIIILALGFFLFIDTQTDTHAWADLIKLAIYLVAGILAVNHFVIKHYQRGLKKKLYAKLFSILDLEYLENTDHIDAIIRNICRESKIFRRYDDIITDDLISGNFENAKFLISDSNISYTTGSGKHRHTEVVFDGLFLAIKTGKNFEGETIIKTDKKFQDKVIGDKKQVHLEDVEFEKLFEVYSTDQVEGRYLLTTAFMDRLVKYRQKKKCEIEVVFSHRTVMSEDTFLFIHNKKDNFELSVFKKMDRNMFYGVLEEIVDALEVIEALKLEQNIGL